MALYKTTFCKKCNIEYPYTISQGKIKYAQGQYPICQKEFKWELIEGKKDNYLELEK